MNSKDFLKEGFVEDAHIMHQDHEVQMAREECYHAAENAIALHKLLRNISEQQGLEGWVSAKITLAGDYLKTVREYIEYELMSAASQQPMLPIAENRGDDDDEEESALYSGCYVRDKEDQSNEVFIMRGSPEDRRVQITDRNGSGWNISPSRLVAVDDSDPAISKYFGKNVSEVAPVRIGSKLPQSDTETFGLEPGRGYKINNPKDRKPGDRPRAVQQLIPTQDKKDHIRSRLGKHKAPVLPEQDTAEGMLDSPGEQDSPVAQAIIRRILMQRTDLLSKYGPEKVGAAVDEVADFVGDVDEIGSSDVSGWVKHVEQMLGNMGEGLAEAGYPEVDHMPGKRGIGLDSAKPRDTYVKTFHASKEKEAQEFAKKNGYIVKKHVYPKSANNSQPHEFQVHKNEQGVAEGSEDLVQIEYWQQETMESGRWVKTKPIPRATAEKIVNSFERGEIVNVEQGVAEGTKCNHTMEGKSCPMHGLKECPGYKSNIKETTAGSVAGVVNPTPKNKAKVGTLFGGTYKQKKAKA